MNTQSDPQIHQDIGRLQGRVDALTVQVSTMEAQLRDVHGVVMRAQGGWRAMVMVGSVSAAVGAIAAKVIGAVWGAFR
jgi:hypothetical protein